MAQVLVGVPKVLQLVAKADQPDGIPSVALSISTALGTNTLWTATFRAHVGEGGAVREVGALDLLTTNQQTEGSRVVGIACVPGAIAWEVMIYSDGVNNSMAAGEAELGVFPDLTEPGLWPVGAFALRHGDRFEPYAGTLAPGNNLVAIAANRSIHTISVWQNGTGGRFYLSSFPTESVWLPPFGSAQIAPKGALRGPQQLNCWGMPAGGGAYLVELGY